MIPVYVDTGPLEDASPQTLFASCTQIVSPESCGPSPRHAAIARIVWQTSLRAQIEIELPRARVQRTVYFQTVDLPEARWQAVGLLVGALLREHRTEPRTPAVIAPHQPTDRRQAAGSVREIRSDRAAVAPRSHSVPMRPALARHQNPPQPEAGSNTEWMRKATSGRTQAMVWVGLGGLAGNALDVEKASASGRIRAGGWLEIGASLWKGLGVLGSTRLSRVLGDVAGVRGGWFSVGLGPSLVLHPVGERFGLRFQVLAHREELRLQFGKETLARGYWSVGAGLGLESALIDGLDVAAVFDVSTTPGQPVRVEGSEVAKNPGIAPLFLIGLKLRLYRGGVPVF